MNKLYILKLLCMFCVFVTVCSCNKVLNPDIIQNPTANNAWQSPRDAETEVASAYDKLRRSIMTSSYYNCLFGDGDVRAGEFYNGNLGYAVLSNNNKSDLVGNLSGWTGFYQTIAQCNLILEKIPTIDASSWASGQKERYVGEAHFLRGLVFFMLARMYREFPLNLKSVNQDTLARTPEKEIFNQIYEDLNMASGSLAWTYPEKAVRATKGAALAIMAHAKAWEHDYKSAEAYCDSVIKYGPYRLITDTSQFKNIFIGGSDEGIFELNWNLEQKELDASFSNGNVTGAASRNTPAKLTMYVPWYSSQGNNQNNPNADVFVLYPRQSVKAAIFPEGKPDARKDYWFLPDKWNKDRPWFGKFRWMKDGTEAWKYNDIIDANGNHTNRNINECNTIITRLADIKLLDAEALAELGRDADAAKQLNDIRQRAQAPLYTLATGNIKDTILAERRIELIGEGQRFFDLVRTRKLDKFPGLINITDPDWYEKNLWTVPINETYIIQSNYKLVQYPVWQ